MGSGSQSFSRDWGFGSPGAGVNADNFSARVTTQRYFAPGRHQIQTTSDDGVRVTINGSTVINRLVDQNSTNTGTFDAGNGGTFSVAIDYYERSGGAKLSFDVPISWNLAAYRENNIFWTSGNAPSSMYSNSTITTKLGTSLGNCTWYVNGRLQQLGYSKAALDTMSGNATTWDNTAGRTVTSSSTPQVGAIAQWDATTSNPLGHVAVVERVNSDGTILISQSSYSPNTLNNYFYKIETIAATAPTRFLIVPRA
ncbi:MAG: CHAP domain-containing protein [Nostocales cyanobacterium]|nr:MAG: CHAP domain-containing protein [Nostocales cyanobacterium]